MLEKLKFYIDGKWVDPVTPKTIDVINPANEEALRPHQPGLQGRCRQGRGRRPQGVRDLVATTSAEERLAVMQKIVEVYQKRYGEFVEAISREMGAPLGLSKNAQAAMGIAHFTQAMKILKDFQFVQVKGTTGHRI